jgi:hypothetical protein
MPPDRYESPSRLRRAGRALGASASADGSVVLLIRAGGALIIVTAVLIQYVLGLAVASARSAWSRRIVSAVQVDRPRKNRCRHAGSR